MSGQPPQPDHTQQEKATIAFINSTFDNVKKLEHEAAENIAKEHQMQKKLEAAEKAKSNAMKELFIADTKADEVGELQKKLKEAENQIFFLTERLDTILGLANDANSANNRRRASVA